MKPKKQYYPSTLIIASLFMVSLFCNNVISAPSTHTQLLLKPSFAQKIAKSLRTNPKLWAFGISIGCVSTYYALSSFSQNNSPSQQKPIEDQKKKKVVAPSTGPLSDIEITQFTVLVAKLNKAGEVDGFTQQEATDTLNFYDRSITDARQIVQTTRSCFADYLDDLKKLI